MKKILIVVAAAIIIIGSFFVLNTSEDTQETSAEKLIEETLLVTTFTSIGEATGNVLLQVPFLKTLENLAYISIAVDSDSDGSFGENEYLVTDFPVRPQANWKSGYYASSALPITDGLSARITIDGTDYTVSTQTQVFEVGELLDLASVTDPENAIKGWGISIAHAEGDTVEITQENVPDISQKPGECGPTAAANSLISLIAKNGKPADLPGTPGEIIEDLKGDMKWTLENGSPTDNFVAGKNAWAKKHGLPIVTEKVGDVHGITTLDSIKEALEAGSAVELRIKFAGADGSIAGGHMVTVTGIHQGDGQTYIDINDPATPEGTETVEIRSNRITNYGPWEGITGMSWGFVQTWKIDSTEQSVGGGVDVRPVAVEMAFSHTKPGEYSEVFAVIMTTPGAIYDKGTPLAA